MHVVSAAGVGGHRRHQRGVDAAGQAQAHAGEPVLRHVVLQAQHAGGVHLLVRVGKVRDVARRLMLGVRVEIEESQMLHEHRGTFQQRAVAVDNEAAAVEHQVILTADLVHVDHRGADLGRTPDREVVTRMGLALLVRRAVHRHQHVDMLVGEPGDRPAVLPDVLADRHADAHAVDVEHDGAVAGREDAELVEHAVVRQEMLVVAGPDHAVVQHDHAVARFVGRVVGADRADGDIQVAQSVGLQLGRQPVRLVPRRLAERAAQRQILDGVSGQRHFREDDDVGAFMRGEMRVVHDFVGVAVEVADAGVDLGKGKTKMGHSAL